MDPQNQYLKFWCFFFIITYNKSMDCVCPYIWNPAQKYDFMSKIYNLCKNIWFSGILVYVLAYSYTSWHTRIHPGILVYIPAHCLIHSGILFDTFRHTVWYILAYSYTSCHTRIHPVILVYILAYSYTSWHTRIHPGILLYVLAYSYTSWHTRSKSRELVSLALRFLLFPTNNTFVSIICWFSQF